MSIGGSSSKSKTSSNTSSDSLGFTASNTYLDAGQRADQTNLINRFNTAYDANSGVIPQISGAPYLASAGNLAAGGGPAGTALNSQAQYGVRGVQALNDYINPNNQYTQGQIANLGADIGKVYREQILPGIGSNFGIAGQRGSSRQGIAEGMAANSALQQFQRGATDLLSNSYNQGAGAATTLANTGTSAAGALGNLQLGGTTAGMAGVNDLNTGAINARNAVYTPFQIGAGVVGAPSTLSNAFGINTSQSRGTSTGKSSSMSMEASL